MNNLKGYWDRIYSVKDRSQVSWTQDIPVGSLKFIHGFKLRKDAAIIDVGGGGSRLVDFLLDEGYSDITVLDISPEAIKKTQTRLGKRAAKIKWIICDVTEFDLQEKYDVWHDRATFHFLTTGHEVARYVSVAATHINPKGFMAIATFSEQGPSKCSGLTVKQYSEAELESALSIHFRKIRCFHEEHVTPFRTVQNFLFCSFSRAA